MGPLSRNGKAMEKLQFRYEEMTHMRCAEVQFLPKFWDKQCHMSEIWDKQ